MWGGGGGGGQSRTTDVLYYRLNFVCPKGEGGRPRPCCNLLVMYIKTQHVVSGSFYQRGMGILYKGEVISKMISDEHESVGVAYPGLLHLWLSESEKRPGYEVKYLTRPQSSRY